MIQVMTAAAAHRGPDGTSTWSGRGAALAHQRLAVLPEDAVEGQPLAVAGLVLVADARIDNRDELLPLLAARGYLIDAGPVSDADVVLAAYRLWGPACPARLIGDFAFAVWDDRRRRLFVARDPMGMRPLYYRWEPHRRVLVGSEIKQILAADGVPRQVHEAALATTLAGPHTPPSWTAYAGIDQLPPGHAMTVDDEGRSSWPFWAPRAEGRFKPADEEAVSHAFRTAFADAVRARLRSARPVGLFLSGGMDSGATASMAGWLAEGSVPSPEVLRTYSWAFAELPDSDERDVSDRIVARYGLAATSVRADEKWPLAGYPEHGPDADDPYSWPYQALVEWTLRHCQQDGVGVVLHGDRGDELTGDWVFDELGMLRAGHVRTAIRDISSVAGTPGLGPLTALRRNLVKPALTARWPAAAARLSSGPQRLWPPWIPDGFAARVALGDIISEARRPAGFDGAARTLRHQRIFMPQGARIAVLNERTRARRGMAFADPFTDRRLIELVLSLPQWLVQTRQEPKRMVRQALVGVMPEDARQAARKNIPYSLFDRGFRDRAVPVVEQLLTGSLGAEHGWLDEQAAREAFAGYVATGDSYWDFWWPITVEMWLRRWWS